MALEKNVCVISTHNEQYVLHLAQTVDVPVELDPEFPTNFHVNAVVRWQRAASQRSLFAECGQYGEGRS